MEIRLMNLLKNIILISFLFVQRGLCGQNESNNWYFGASAGLNFSSGIATAVTTFNLIQSEGCSSISDNLGNLLFYTNGKQVKNKNHGYMPNGLGLLGSSTSTQSAVIVKKPGSNTIYYIFTTDDEFGPDGLRYSIVDMSLQGGLGDVTSKNVNINTNAREKVTAIQHQNGTDFWIVTHKLFSNQFLSFLLSSSGLNMTPTISSIGATTSGLEGIGYLSASLNGNKVAVAKWDLNIVEVFNFNKSTGTLSGLKTLTNSTSPYGVEFSPNDRFLYVSESLGNGSNVYQYDLLAGTVNNIENSQITLGNFPIQFGALQLAPDYKIYLAKFNNGQLGVINDPDSLGLACNFNINGLNLLGKSSILGLPNLPKALLPVFKYSNKCYGDSTSFNVLQTDVDSVLWDFGDLSSGVNNSSLDISPKHLFTDTGVFTVTLVRYKASNTYTKSQSVYISPLPIVSITPFNPDTLCDGETTTITAGGATTYSWDNGAGTNSSVSVSPSTTTTYTVTGTNGKSNQIDHPITV